MIHAQRDLPVFLDELMDGMARIDPQQARIVELCIY